MRWNEPTNLIIPAIVLTLFAIFLGLMVGVGYATHRGIIQFYGNTMYRSYSPQFPSELPTYIWTLGCWIRREYLAEGIGLEYAWLWLAILMNVLFYIPMFLVLNKVIWVWSWYWSAVRIRRWLFPFRLRQHLRRASAGNRPHRMLLWDLL